MRGSFDPEVMSVVYLINSVGQPGAVRATLLAWIITFGRHPVSYTHLDVDKRQARDVTIQAQSLRLMNNRKKEKGTAILFITHDLGVINQMADDVAVMYCGQVVEMTPARTIFDQTISPYLHPYTEGLLHSIPRLDTEAHTRLEVIPGSVPHPADLDVYKRQELRCLR